MIVNELCSKHGKHTTNSMASITEVLEFADENPAWIPYETLIAMQKVNEKNDTVEYTGCSDEQVRWGNNDDPRSFLIVGTEYKIEKVDVHRQHTKIKLYNKMGWFNSGLFQISGN